jgi:hypothetical protein
VIASRGWRSTAKEAAKAMSTAPWITRPAPKPKRKPAPPTIPEWLLQAAMVAEFNLLEDQGYALSAVGDMNAGRRSYQEAAKCKAMGMRSGEPDLRLYGASARVLFIEVKTTTGRKSTAQDNRHDRLAALGFTVLVVAPRDEAHARSIAREIATKFCDPAGGLL